MYPKELLGPPAMFSFERVSSVFQKKLDTQVGIHYVGIIRCGSSCKDLKCIAWQQAKNLLVGVNIGGRKHL